MEIIGKLQRVMPVETGTSARGPWTKGAFVIETEEQFPKKVYFTLWGEDKVAAVNAIGVGQQIKVHFSPESREFNERWYTDLRCFRIDTFNPATAPQQGMPQGFTQPQQQFSQPAQAQPMVQVPQEQVGSFNTASTPEDDDLPF